VDAKVWVNDLGFGQATRKRPNNLPPTVSGCDVERGVAPDVVHARVTTSRHQ